MEKEKKRGILFVVSTPIGNLKDISLRAVDTLGSVDLIVCEDTRVTKRLLSAYGISKALISYREQNRENAGRRIVQALIEGKDAALVTDAGAPGISDPGSHLVSLCIEKGISVAPIPGPSSIIAALTVSGLCADRFVFLGFLPRKGKKRDDVFSILTRETRTTVIFESPVRVLETLGRLYERIGDRRAVLCRELTKAHEEIVRGRLSEIIEIIDKRDEVRGEVVIVLAGADERKGEINAEEISREIVKIVAINPDKRVKELADLVSDRLNIPSRVAYDQIVLLRKK